MHTYNSFDTRPQRKRAPLFYETGRRGNLGLKRWRTFCWSRVITRFKTRCRTARSTFCAAQRSTQIGQLSGQIFLVLLSVQSTFSPLRGLHSLCSLGHFFSSGFSRQCAAQVAWQFFSNILRLLHLFTLHLFFLSLQDGGGGLGDGGDGDGGDGDGDSGGGGGLGDGGGGGRW